MVELGITTRNDGIILITVRGELDLTDVGHVERVVTTGRRDADKVIVDSRAVTFMDSSGLALLMRLQRRADAEEWFIAHVTSEPVMGRVRRMGLDTILRWAEVDGEGAAMLPARPSPSRGHSRTGG